MSGFNVYPSEVEDVIGEVPASPGRRDRGGGRHHGRSRRRLRPRPRCRPGDHGRGGPRPPRAAARPVQAAEPDRGRRRAAADRDRQGPEGPPAGGGAPTRSWACSSSSPYDVARPGGAGIPAMTPRVTLYSRPGCHPADDARAVIVRVCADWEERRGLDRRRTCGRSAVHRGDPGDLRRRAPARLLAGRRDPAAGRPRALIHPRGTWPFSHVIAPAPAAPGPLARPRFVLAFTNS